MSKHYYLEKEKKITPVVEDKSEEVVVEESKPLCEKFTATHVNLRSAPNGQIITTLTGNMRVVIESEDGEWSKLVNGLWVRSDLLK